MLYALEQGPVEKAVIKSALWKRQKIPDAIANAPTLLPGLDLFWSAYKDMSAYRHDGHLDLQTVLAWADTHGIEGDLRWQLVRHCGALNAVHRKHEIQKLNEEREAARGG